MSPLTTNTRTAQCADFLAFTLDIESEEFPGADQVDGDWMTEMINESARSAGFSDAEIGAAWDLINEQEGA